MINYRDNNIASLLEKHFALTSSCLNILLPLLESLNWQGDLRRLVEALPHKAQQLDMPLLLRTIENLEYEYQSFDAKKFTFDARSLPALFETDTGQIFLLSNDESGQVVLLAGDDKSHATWDDLNAMSGRIYLFKRKTAADQKNALKKNWLFEVIQRYRKPLLNIFLVSFFANLFFLATPIYIMFVYDRFITTGSYQMLTGFLIGVSVALLAGFLLQIIRARVIGYISSRLDFYIGNEIFHKILYLPIIFSESSSTSAQIDRIKDFDHAREMLTNLVITLIFDLPFVLLALVLIGLVAGFYMALVPIFLLLLLYLISLIFRYAIRADASELAQLGFRYRNFFTESLSELIALKALGVIRVWQERYKVLLSDYAYKTYQNEILNESMTIFSNQYVIFAGVVSLTAGVFAVFTQQLSMGGLIAVMILIWRVLSPYRLFLITWAKSDQMKLSLQQINTIIRAPEDSNQLAVVPNSESLQGNLRFHQVSMRYPRAAEPAVININFKLPAKTMLGIAGRNGSGKSTILKLILGFYPVDAGTISLDDINIRQFDPRQIRMFMGYVPQKSHFFYGTIKQNLLLANPQASDEEIQQVLLELDLMPDIERLGLGIETGLHDQPEKYFSSSFLQRLSIARALLRKPLILLLDEPSAGFDFDQDQTFIHLLQRLKQKMTIILVSERPSHLKQADYVMILENGRMIALGKAEEVVAKLLEILRHE